ncbi:MAG TPA: SH3 domain-containing protein [Bdellovibrionota bacterium]|nr:SH3 domain-containing protein [Bdellovibrionota bacterium]
MIASLFKRLTLASFFLSMLAVSGVAFGQTKGTVNGNNVAVRSDPNTKSEILITLEKGKAVTVIEQRGGWLRIKVALDAAFTFDGWVSAKLITWKKPAAASVVASKKAAPAKTPVASVTTPAPVSPRINPTPSVPSASPPTAPAGGAPTPLDQFFESSGSVPPPATTNSPSATANKTFAQIPSDAEGPGRPANFERPPTRQDFLTPLGDRASAAIRVGYLLYHYKLQNGGATPSELFAYNLPGFGVDVDLRYWFWNMPDEKFRIGGSLFYQHGFYRHTTNLQDSSGATFQSPSTSSSTDNMWGKVLTEYRFNPQKSLNSVGLAAGFQYFKFSGDDVNNDTGPINLYVSQKTMSVTTGVEGHIEIPRTKNLVANLGFDLFILNFVSEDPSDATGTDPSANIGYGPSVGLAWLPTYRHRIGAGYQLRLQKYEFTGAGTRVGNAVTDGSADTAAHNFFLAYDYHF